METFVVLLWFRASLWPELLNYRQMKRSEESLKFMRSSLTSRWSFGECRYIKTSPTSECQRTKINVLWKLWTHYFWMCSECSETRWLLTFWECSLLNRIHAQLRDCMKQTDSVSCSSGRYSSERILSWISGPRLSSHNLTDLFAYVLLFLLALWWSFSCRRQSM